jgi:hypothetical protein
MTVPGTDSALFEFDDDENEVGDQAEDDRDAEDFDDPPICGRWFDGN